MYYSLQKSNHDPEYWQALADCLELDTSREMREYPRGNKQKVSVVLAFMNWLEPLTLDESTTGLDPSVHQTVMELVREVNRAGATVFLSPRILPEVQAVCDRAGIIRDGQLVATEWVEDLTQQQFKRIHFRFAKLPPVEAFARYEAKEMARDEQGIALEIYAQLDKVMEAARTCNTGSITWQTRRVSRWWGRSATETSRSERVFCVAPTRQGRRGPALDLSCHRAESGLRECLVRGPVGWLISA